MRERGRERENMLRRKSLAVTSLSLTWVMTDWLKEGSQMTSELHLCYSNLQYHGSYSHD